MAKKHLELLFLKNLHGFGPVKINTEYQQVVQNTDIDGLCEFVLRHETNINENDVFKARKNAESIFEAISNNNEITVFTVIDEEYPLALRDMKSKKPVIIYAMGNISCLGTRGVAVVGTRNPTDRTSAAGPKIVKSIIEKENSTIISGLANGCDEIAHKSALENKTKTIAVLAFGFNKISPTKQKQLAQEILNNNGCLVSEYEPDVAAQKSTFVRRDAIIAALSSSVIVLECGVKSGTMHTVEEAIIMNRAVACFLPDDATESFSGCYHLIKHLNKTRLICPNDVKTFLGNDQRTEPTLFE